MKSENAVILFTRIPVLGKTKTRLQPFLSPEECCLLQKAFIRDIYSVLLESGADVIICYNPEGDLSDLEKLLPGSEKFIAQTGIGLGDRMFNAFSQVLGAGYRRCLLIGSDVPLISANNIQNAFMLLDKHDIVVCPTEDGGYYLIGMNTPIRSVFQLDQYGDCTVLDNTIKAAELSEKTVAIGETTIDIDEERDMIMLADLLRRENPRRMQGNESFPASLGKLTLKGALTYGYYRPETDCTVQVIS